MKGCKISIEEKAAGRLPYGVAREVLDLFDGEEIVIAVTEDMVERETEDVERWYWVRAFRDENGERWHVWYDMNDDVTYVSFGYDERHEPYAE